MENIEINIITENGIKSKPVINYRFFAVVTSRRYVSSDWHDVKTPCDPITAVEILLYHLKTKYSSWIEISISNAKERDKAFCFFRQ